MPPLRMASDVRSGFRSHDNKACDAVIPIFNSLSFAQLSLSFGALVSGASLVSIEFGFELKSVNAGSPRMAHAPRHMAHALRHINFVAASNRITGRGTQRANRLLKIEYLSY